MTSLVQVATSELSGVALDWAVYNAIEGLLEELRIQSYPESEVLPFPSAKWLEFSGPFGEVVRWQPSRDWSQGGHLLEEWQIFLSPPTTVHRSNYDEKTGKTKGCWETYESWHATVSARVCTRPPKIEGLPGTVGRGEGDTPLVAACRAIVAAKLGDEVQVPAELMEVANASNPAS